MSADPRGSFDRLRTGSSAALRSAQDDGFFEGEQKLEAQLGLAGSFHHVGWRYPLSDE